MKCIILTFLSKVPSKNKINVGRIVSGNSGIYWSTIEAYEMFVYFGQVIFQSEVG